jgi:endoglucanase
MEDCQLLKAPSRIHRRSVLKSLAGIAVAGALPAALAGLEKPAPKTASINPKWYGFNLMEYFSTDPDWMKYFPFESGHFQEDDFRWMRDWGFNWVRLPMDYRFWTDANDPMQIREKDVEPIDRAIRLGEKYGVHVNVSLHRAPGYCILDGMDEKFTKIHITPERSNMFSSSSALDAFVHQWVYFAGRYAAISSKKLSFNLVNEPIDFVGKETEATGKEYVRVARAAIAGIRGKDHARLIVTDGYPSANSPIPDLYDANIVQSCHDYSPYQLTCYQCEWVRPASDGLPVPTWPLQDAQGKVIADKHTIEEQFRPWTEPAQHGVPIHFGEMGCNRYTSPDVVYAWINDTLDMIGSLNSGWALWNLRGSNGIVDTNRPGTQYKDWHGHKLDFTLLSILQSKMKL